MTGQWRKSSFSQGSEHCVEIRESGDAILIRDSKYLRDPANDPALQPIISIATHDWAAFLRLALGIPAPRPSRLPSIDRLPGGGVALRDRSGTTLTYTAPEWRAFALGIGAGEFAAA